MKHLLIILALFGGFISVSAQTISRDVISSSGGSFTAGANQLDFTIGESFITTLDVGSNIITQGFQQPCPQLISNTFLGINAPLDPVQADTAFNLSANFIGANLTSAQWYFSSSGEINNLEEAEFSFLGSIVGGMVTDTFNFDTSQTGVYTVKLVVTDACGVTAEANYDYVVIYDPSGGFVTGGGWIYSEEGAYIENTAAVGKANFGFVAKYKTGNNNTNEVDGNTNFQFKAGDFHFKSSSHKDMSLVISGERKATYKGIGTVNGSGNYGFMVTVVDGEAPGAGQGDVDTFRIKIWVSGSPNNVVYDNEMGSAENTDAATGLGGGSIKIHKPNGNGKSAPNSETVFDDIELVSWPNPSNQYFNIKLKSKNTVDKINIQVFDLNGRLVSLKTGAPNQEYQIGGGLQAGLYFVNVIQGNALKTIRLIKY